MKVNRILISFNNWEMGINNKISYVQYTIVKFNCIKINKIYI